MGQHSVTLPSAMELLGGLFIVLVLSMIVLPFVVARGWDGYGPYGTFIYNDEYYSLRYNDNTFGNDKPHVFLLGGWPPFVSSVSLLEISDQHSQLGGDNLFRDFTVKSTLSNEGIEISYANQENTVVKTVEVLDGAVQVAYRLHHQALLNLSMWRWYISEIDGIWWRDVDSPLVLNRTSSMEFRFELDGKLLEGTVTFSPEPISISAWKTPEGFNKIVASFNATDVRITIASSGMIQAWALSPRGGWLFYPALAMASTGFFLVDRRYGSRVKVRATWNRH